MRLPTRISLLEVNRQRNLSPEFAPIYSCYHGGLEQKKAHQQERKKQESGTTRDDATNEDSRLRHSVVPGKRDNTIPSQSAFVSYGSRLATNSTLPVSNTRPLQQPPADENDSPTVPPAASALEATVPAPAFAEAVSQMATLQLSQSFVHAQEAIWKQIQQNRRTGHDDSVIRDVATPERLEDASQQSPFTLYLHGKKVKVVPQAQVQKAHEAGQTRIVTCVVCATKLVVTCDMTIVYCPECGSLSSSTTAACHENA